LCAVAVIARLCEHAVRDGKTGSEGRANDTATGFGHSSVDRQHRVYRGLGAASLGGHERRVLGVQ
jgi:hypothetical protein